MSDWLVLGLIATGFYLYECCTWTAATAFACYRKPLRSGWAAAPGAELPGNESGGFVFADPLTLSGSIIHSSHWPIAIGPDGICIDSADASRFWTFESISSIAADDRAVLINGEMAFRAASESLAMELAGHLATIQATASTERPGRISALLAQSFDPSLLQDRWSAFVESSRALRFLAALPLIWLTTVTPISLLLFGPLSSWPILLGGLFLSALSVSIEFVRVHRAELPKASDRWLHAVSMTLFPIAAIRAADRISKECVTRFNPLTVAGVFCDRADGDPVLRRFGFDLERAVANHEIPEISRCRDWYRARQRDAFRTLLKTLRRDPFVEPERTDPAMAAFCPRCHNQYREGTPACSDCVDVTLSEFVNVSKSRAERKRRRA